MKNLRYSRSLSIGLGLAILGTPISGIATDIADAPLFTTSPTKVKPNVMFVLDDSGSMGWDFMPDDARFSSSSFNTHYGRRASQCNGLGFIPDEGKAPYPVPVTATGVSVGNASTAFLSGAEIPPAVANDSRVTGSGNVDYLASVRQITDVATLNVVSSGSITVKVSGGNSGSYAPGMVASIFGWKNVNGNWYRDNARYMIGKVTSWSSATGMLTIAVEMAVGTGTISTPYVGNGSPIDNVYYTYTGTYTPRLDYQYTATKTNGVFISECGSSIPSTPGRSVFTANIVTPTSPLAQRYANWYHYYSKRMSLMKTSLTLAFKDLDDKYRVGLALINDGSSALPPLDIADFTSIENGDVAQGQKSKFYAQINAAEPSGNTPLRAALARVGSYYAKKLPNQKYDPIQYSCQKNFTILSTDGYWNSSAGYKLDGTAVGEQDAGTTPRPMYDGGVTQSTTTETWTESSSTDRTRVTPKTITTKTTKVDTVYTPYQGQSRISYTLNKPTYTTFTNSDVSRSCTAVGGKQNCTITIKTSANHGYSTGQLVTVSGVTPAEYNGTFTVTKKDNNEYQYTLNGLAAQPAIPGSGSRGTSNDGTSGCPSGQGKILEQTQTRDLRHGAKLTTVTTKVDQTAQTVVDRTTVSIPYTRTIKATNGVINSDTGPVAGSSSTTTTTVSNTTATTSSNTTVDGPSSEPIADLSTAWVNSGAAVAQMTCSTTLPSPNPSVAVNAAISTPVATTSATTVDGPTTVTGTVSDTTSAPVTTVGAKTMTVSDPTTGGSSDSLSDVAMYYYKTDLRTSELGNCAGALGADICANDVGTVGEDNANWQHMSTYTLSLGVSGTLKYDPDYLTQNSGDYRDVVTGSKNWPVPSSDAGAVNIDDLWHAAVNGRGRYFSATDPTTLASSLAAALNTIKSMEGSSSAAATSTLQPVEGDNGVYIARFMSEDWTGDLRAYKIDPNTGKVPINKLDADGKLIDIADWSAAAQLSPTTVRKIYYFKAGGTNLREFTYANLTADGMNSLFDNGCTKSPALSQCASLGADAKATVDSGSNMVSYLRGQPQSQYRLRAQVLGDIVNSSPVYVGKPGFLYTESNYGTFKSEKANRSPTLYVGANDGMLHAFDATNGQERWAFIPSMVMSKMYRLADKNYATNHQYFVDATPVAGDIFADGKWKTILVGGLNAGGSGYYALDVTDPTAPIALWEFKPATMGLSYGNPIITKRKDGTWVVVVTSGYNNPDGEGHLYVINANTGALLKQIDTGAGSAGNPSGLGKINAWVDFDTENRATRFYGGDMLGNVWRFDHDDLLEPKGKAFKLATLQIGATPQPITTAPALAEIEANGAKRVVVYVGTGRYLGKTDVDDKALQSIYGIKDSLTATELGDVRASNTLVKQTLVTSGLTRTTSAGNPVDWGTKNGWYLDLKGDTAEGERVNVDMQLAFDVLTAAGNIPGSTASDCAKAGSGTSWLYQIDIKTGTVGSNFGGAKAKTPPGERITSMVAGLSTVQLGKGTGVTIVTKTDVSEPLPKTIDQPSSGAGPAKRSSWRELID